MLNGNIFSELFLSDLDEKITSAGYERHKGKQRNKLSCPILCTYQCYARGGEPRDRVGTFIRNENLESNFLTLGIRFQFKVPHLGEGFEFNISLETENFKPSEHEVKNMCLQ